MKITIELDNFSEIKELKQWVLSIPDDVDPILNESIEILELSAKSNNCLRIINVHTIGDLLECSEEDLMRINNFGRRSLNEIKDMLALKGLGLRKI